MSHSRRHATSASHLRAKAFAGGLAVLIPALAGPDAGAQPRTVRPTSTTPVGTTPAIIGINSGNFIEGTNNATFLRWSGVNGSRTFTSAPNIEQVDDIPGVGDGVNSQASLLARMAAVRANPTDPTLINFAEFERGYFENQSDFIDYDLAYRTYNANNIAPLAIINRSQGQFPFADPGTPDSFADQYEHWQHIYAQAYFLGGNYDVERFSYYNEPDAASQEVTQADYLLRLQLASDAVQSALADVNRDFGKTLQPNVIAPITAGGANEYFRRLDNTDTRDDQQGWGELVINNLNTNFLGEVDPDFQLIQTYGYQQYNQEGEVFASDLNFIQDAVRDDLRENNLVGEVNFALTEFNVHSNGVFATRDDTLDEPSRFAKLGSIFANLATAEADELFVFKFDSNAEDDFQGNAVFTNSRFDEPYNVGGATKAAGVLKLFTKGFAGANDLLETSEGQNNLDVVTSYNAEQDTFYLLAADESSSQNREFTYDLAALGIEAGARIQIEEVSEGKLAEVVDQQILEADGLFTFTQTQQSVILISVPRTAPDRVIDLTATDDATVRAANNSGSNFGDSENIFVRNVASAGDAGGRAVGLVEFDGSALTEDVAVERAVLSLTGEIDEGDAQFVTLHVYGIIGDGFDEDTITWDGVSNLADSTGDVSLIADNFLAGVGETAEFVGHLTVTQETGEVLLDVTEFVQEFASEDIQFLIAREVRFEEVLNDNGSVRFAGDVIDRSFGAARFDSSESGNGPQLSLELRDVAVIPEPGTAALLGGLALLTTRKRRQR